MSKYLVRLVLAAHLFAVKYIAQGQARGKKVVRSLHIWVVSKYRIRSLLGIRERKRLDSKSLNIVEPFLKEARMVCSTVHQELIIDAIFRNVKLD